MTLPQTFHPRTGFHYVMELPFVDNVPIADVAALYRDVQRRWPWLSLIDRIHFDNLYDSGAPETDDERYFFVLWDVRSLAPRRERKSFFVPVYLEALGGDVLPEHRRYQQRFEEMMRDADASFGHTPWVASELQAMTKKPAYTLPLGWSPSMDPGPVEKTVELSQHGVAFGRREILLPALQERLSQLVTMRGFGADILRQLASSRANLYVPHCNPTTLSTWRTWQMVSIGTTALITQSGDSWPMTPDHYLPISPICEDRIGVTVEEVERHLRESDLIAVASQMRKDLGPEYTVDRCLDNYLVPASEAIRGFRR